MADDVLVELPALRREAELGLADAMQSCRQWSEAIELLTRVRERDARVMSAQELVSVACALSRCYRHSGDLTRAVLVAEEMVDGSVRPAWSDGLVRLGVKLLAAYIERGDLLRGSQFCGELLVGAELVGDASLLASVHRVAASWRWRTAAAPRRSGMWNEPLSFTATPVTRAACAGFGAIAPASC